MAPSLKQTTRVRTLIIARLFVATFFLFCAQFVFKINLTVYYAIISIISILSIIYVLWWLTGKSLTLLAYIQIFFDLLIESILIYYTGGIDSVYSTIYILTIISSSFVLLPYASFYAAALSGIVFTFTVLAYQKHWLPFAYILPSPDFISTPDAVYVFYACYVKITVFVIVSILTYYFSAHILRLEKQVRMQRRLVFLGQVTSSIAHEIRNPLASISGTVELLARQLNDRLNENQQNLMTAIVEESSRVKRIFSGLLDYSRIPELKLSSIDFESFMDQVLLLLEHQDGYQPQVKVSRLYKGKKIRLKADPEFLKQAVMNVLINAHQAMPEGGDLVIDARPSRNQVSMIIEDTGSGMSRETLNSIFVPFKTTKKNGTGLGLAEAHKIVTQHEGTIRVKSEAGKGTRVEIILPGG
ncbi:MAG: hypothetical protein A3G33_07285 [Omnitrophica bacterium RIFCSPLOWO2_12_FULL_44_17]|uniref:histidine kinase n=1 Tax=Candidatus Danuiimicrobium aquiferis TaxID=1801832 RepID=A0A1G1KZF1_9BACT|nr:MAG: hypothetical protein A3B72_07585 [Omnitrophica bacterium RIFCSPHIGHO2_02_FULL_45_28]OGW89230.1 MAG: hypothetical protein A3E74_08260 [Omnitrophica bacterium RIFCSPHIGHO2_12_FULL_44_12]OGW98029.1 MAG: hypothetical protein A3G33_07285 [Omnitrophica bacterium RIFCSPLOWO2_12_FULL_44_17]OGX03526.1 MAG: hypothetical protein A3J12_02945 [Omnitrophica bacterium RIFCSPLOWO2_02_FULL_44_11]